MGEGCLRIQLPQLIIERLESVISELGVSKEDFLDVMTFMWGVGFRGFDVAIGGEQDYGYFELSRDLSDKIRELSDRLGIEAEKAAIFFGLGLTPFIRVCGMRELLEVKKVIERQ